MFNKTIQRNVTNHSEVTLHELINKELDRCWAFLNKQMKLSGDAAQGNCTAIFKKIEKLHELIATLAEKSPDTDMYKTVKDLQEHMAERILLEEKGNE